MSFAQSARPIEGAVATVGVSDRITFLRRTYAHLGGALIAWAALTAIILKFMTPTSLKFSAWALNGRWNWLMVIGLFMVVGWIAERLARSETSRAVQYLGLGVEVLAWSILLQPMIWMVMFKFGGDAGRELIMSGQLSMSSLAGRVIGESVVITLAIFIGLTVTVFVTKKDFSFMRSVLVLCTFAALGVIIASMIFGFHLGAIFSGLMILLMGGYILYQTSSIMRDFPPTAYVAAALMLFSTVATLFWYVLRLVMSLRSE